MVKVRSTSSLTFNPSSTSVPDGPVSGSFPSRLPSPEEFAEAAEAVFMPSSAGICGRLIVMTKSVDLETSLIKVINIVVDVGVFGVLGGFAGVVLATSVSAGFIGLCVIKVSSVAKR